MTALWLANTSDNANAVSVLEAEAKPTTISKHRSYLAAAFHTTSPDRICWIINTPNVWWRVSSMGHYMFNGYICFVFLFYWGFNKPVVSHIKSHIWRQHNLLWLTLWLDLKKKKTHVEVVRPELWTEFWTIQLQWSRIEEWAPDVL